MGPVLATDSKPSYMMKAFAIVLLAAVAVKAEADADAYTIGQVNHGFTHGGIITGVDYGHGVVSGVGAIGNRGVYGVHGVHTRYAGPYAANVYGHGVYNRHFYGKREAEAEAEADPYFLNGVYGTGVATTYGHHGVVGAVHGVAAAVPAVHTAVVSTYGHHVAAAVPAVHTVAAVPAVHSTVAAVPAVHTTVGGYTAASGINHGVYGGIYNRHFYGKREADAEPEPYTIGQVAYGLPVHNAYATGHPHNVGYTNYVSTGYHGLGHVGYAGHFYG